MTKQPLLTEVMETLTEVKIQILVMDLMRVQMQVGVGENKDGTEQRFLLTNWKNLKEHLLEHTTQMSSLGKNFFNTSSLTLFCQEACSMRTPDLAACFEFPLQGPMQSYVITRSKSGRFPYQSFTSPTTGGPLTCSYLARILSIWVKGGHRLN